MVKKRTASLNIKTDANDKKEFEAFCEDMGMNMTTAVNMFIKYVLRTQELPFKVSEDIPNAETIKAMKEAEQITKHPEKYKGYDSVDELFRDLEK